MLCVTLLKARTTLASRGKFPGFLVTAPMAATGKTELVEVLTLAVTGETIPFSAFPTDDEAEMNKLIMTIVMSDPSCFCFDNVKNGHSIRSAVLDQYITRDSFQGRLLGTNTLGNFPALSVVVATGNNIEAAEDSATRFLEIRLQPKTDNPQNQHYDRDAKSYTMQHRAKILSALRLISNVEHDLKKKGRFPGWFQEVAGPVMQISGDHGLLDKWDEGGSTIKNAGAFEDFLVRLREIHQKHQLAEIWPDDVTSLALDEYAALVRLPDDLVEAASALLDPAMSEAARALTQKRRKAARMKITQGMMNFLKKWRDQVSGNLRLRIRQGRNANRKLRTYLQVEGAAAPGPQAHPGVPF
jgi:hypothetical protein